LYTKIDELIWKDEKFPKLSDDTKLLFFYILTNPHRNILGCYFLPLPYAIFDIGWDLKRLDKGLQELLRKGFINHDLGANILLIKNYLKYNPLENPNQVKAAIKALTEIPPNGMDSDLHEIIKGLDKPLLKPLVEGLAKRLPKPVTVTVTVAVTEDITVPIESEDKTEESNVINDEAKDEIIEEVVEEKSVYERVITYLNAKLGTNYRFTTKKTQESINARLNENFTADDFKTVIDKKTKEWKGSDMEQYLRPETLFGTKFESYLNQKIVIGKKDTFNAGANERGPEYYMQLNAEREILQKEKEDKEGTTTGDEILKAIKKGRR